MSLFTTGDFTTAVDAFQSGILNQLGRGAGPAGTAITVGLDILGADCGDSLLNCGEFNNLSP